MKETLPARAPEASLSCGKLPARFFELLAHLLWPSCCPACGRLGVSFCPACLDEVFEPLPPFCLDCGGRFGVPCCTGSVPCLAATVHTGLSRRFLINFKYHNERSLGYAMGRLLAELPPQAADVAVPVPLRGNAARDYNQAAVLASGLAAHSGMEQRDALLWRGRSRRQVGKGAGERQAIPAGAIMAQRELAGKKVLLIDDVYTTGATLRAARDAVQAVGGTVAAAVVWSRRLRPGEMLGDGEFYL